MSRLYAVMIVGNLIAYVAVVAGMLCGAAGIVDFGSGVGVLTNLWFLLRFAEEV